MKPKHIIIGVIALVITIASSIALYQLLRHDTKITKAQMAAINKEARDWQWNTYPILCPPLKPIYGPSLDDRQREHFDQAMKHLERETGIQLYNAQDGRNPPVYLHSNLPESLKNEEDFCKRGSWSGTVGRTYRTPSFGAHIQRIDIVVCFDLIEKARRYRMEGARGYKDAKALAAFGELGTNGHELLHPFFGDDMNKRHPTVLPGIFGKRARDHHVGPVVKQIFATRILPHCRRLPTEFR